MNKNIFFISLSFFLFSVSNLHAKASPSFDCDKASNEVEKLICSDDELAKLDVEMNDWYKKVIRWQAIIANYNTSGTKEGQQGWLERRNNFECPSKSTNKKDCLISSYKEAIQVYKNTLLRYELHRACNWPGDEPLSRKCDFGYVENLLKNGADLKGYSEFYGQCWIGPVYYTAFSTSKKEIVDYVINQGMDFKEKVRDDCKYNTQVLDVVGAFEFFDEIIKVNPNLDLNGGETNTYLINFIQRAINNSIYSDKNLYLIETLLSHGADINVTIKTNKYHPAPVLKNGDNSLIAIFKFGILAKEFPYDYERTLEVIRLLKKHKIDLSHKNDEGHDALYYLKNSPYHIDETYYKQFEELLTY